MNRFGIHFRLLLAGFFLINFTTFLFGYMGVRISHNFVQTRFEERMRFLARYLALNAELGILIDERTMLNRLAQNLLAEKDVVQVTIFNQFEDILAEKSQISEGRFSTVEAPVLLKEVQDESRVFLWQKGSGQNDNIIGMVRITYTTHGINRLLDIMKNRFVWLSVGLSCFSILIFYFLSRSLVSPVTQLAQAARQVANGNLKLRVTPKSELRETRELAMAFNAMLDSIENGQKALEKANQEMLRQKMLAEMGKFSLMIAHEVKNPLSIIKSSMDVLKKDHRQLSQNLLVEFIEDEIRRLNRLIEDFLLFSKPSKPAFRSVDVHALIQECSTRLELQASEGVSVEVKIPPESQYMDIDPDLLHRAFANIIKNAIDSNGNDNLVTVNSFHKSDRWIIEISDQGCGISPENLPKIFEPFFTTRAKGTGLGLAYVSQVVQAHDGRIFVWNKMEKGAAIRVEIPNIKRVEWLQQEYGCEELISSHTV